MFTIFPTAKYHTPTETLRLACGIYAVGRRSSKEAAIFLGVATTEAEGSVPAEEESVAVSS